MYGVHKYIEVHGNVKPTLFPLTSRAALSAIFLQNLVCSRFVAFLEMNL